uniref:RING finger and CHY zinc finger domain-containing protein 1 n=1 Tax=Mus musculus TaxID=10090 RepID=UPI00017532CF|nr:Chain A, RING finger and CHY zinc finger domain-containing protein 1 [Mus musculus]
GSSGSSGCPICLEDIHTSRVVAHVLPCGHLLHRTCYEEMLKEGYRCPLCSGPSSG